MALQRVFQFAVAVNPRSGETIRKGDNFVPCCENES